jgi:hypothetical protein
MTISQVFNKSISPEEAKIIIQDEINSASISKSEIEISCIHCTNLNLNKIVFNRMFFPHIKIYRI